MPVFISLLRKREMSTLSIMAMMRGKGWSVGLVMKTRVESVTYFIQEN